MATESTIETPSSELDNELSAYEYIEKLRDIYNKYTSTKFFSMLNACVNCGACAKACHYYCSEKDKNYVPANRVKQLNSIISEYFHPIKSKIRLGKPSNPMTNPKFDTLFKAAFENCTLCGNCALACPMGINTGEIMYVARALLFGLGKVPSGLMGPVNTTLLTGNYLGLSDEDFIDTIEWLAEEMEEDMGEGFTIPIDKKNAKVLYIPHPLTLRDLPFLLMDELKILAAAGEDYTLSTHDFDVVNYAFYQGSKENAYKVANTTLEARKIINAECLTLAPCGHGYRVLKHEMEKIIGERFDFPIYTFVELIDRYVQEGRIELEKDIFEGPVTYHDPCNIGRRGGVIEEPRRVLKALTSNFVEMQPHGVHNYCCGGGGGLASTGDLGHIRQKMGKAKAEQIRKTGAKTVVTGCFNCKNQIRDISVTHDMDFEVKSIVEVVANSIKGLSKD
jgi:Fe-S oxidoreductase